MTVRMRYGRMSFKHLCSLLNPWFKSPLRILGSCDIIIYVKKRVSSLEEPNANFIKLKEVWIWGFRDVEDESEGLVIGENGARETKSMNYERKELFDDGKLALIWGEYFAPECEEYKFLPKYNELKFLRGSSRLVVIAIQAIGYIYVVIFRSVMDLRVALVEVIGLYFNVLLLIGASLSSFSNVCKIFDHIHEQRARKKICKHT